MLTAATVALVGLSACIADLGKVKMTSVIGWLLWSVVHLFFLIGAQSHHRLRELGLGLADLRPRARLVISIELQTRKEFGYLDGIAHCSPSCRSGDADLARDLLDPGPQRNRSSDPATGLASLDVRSR